VIRRQPAHCLALTLLVACAAWLVAGCGGDGAGAGSATDADPTVTYDVAVEDGAVVGGPQTFRADVGDVVQLSVQSDTADEVHVHGIDVTVDVEPGEPAEITFEAAATGAWEIELHEAELLLGTLEVR
jgi:plastocyanin